MTATGYEASYFPRIVLSPSGEYLVSVSYNVDPRIIIHKQASGEVVSIYTADFTDISLTKVAFNPSETILYSLTMDSSTEVFCRFILSTTASSCVKLESGEFLTKT